MNAKSPSMSSVPVAIVDATSLKMSLGTIFDRVLTEDLKITKHGNPQAVVMSLERYERLSRLEPVDAVALDALRAEFDAKYAHMQTRKQEAAMNLLMDADEDDITAFLGQHYDANPVAPMAKETSPTAPETKSSKRTRISILTHDVATGAMAFHDVISASGHLIRKGATGTKASRLAATFTETVLGKGALSAKPATTTVKARLTQKKGAK